MVKSIDRSGTTFTAKNSSGTSLFTFTQQDNNNTYPDAIKNITRSGTTFTATRYSGGTFTFTQQDNNTTYSAATTSANGLMSSKDKTRFDSACTFNGWCLGFGISAWGLIVPGILYVGGTGNAGSSYNVLITSAQLYNGSWKNLTYSSAVLYGHMVVLIFQYSTANAEKPFLCNINAQVTLK